MREIKFRLWDKEKKIMLNVRSIDFEDCYFDTGGMYIDTIEGLDYWNSELYSLMQFTGLHDKNGKEIYEGDIVKVFTNGKWRAGKIIYEYSGFSIDVTNNKELEYGRTSIIEKLTEAIGNIYENKELINETNR